MRNLAPAVTRVALLLALLGPVAWAGSVLVVDQDNGPGTDFQQLQFAMEAAIDGDLLLVRSGSYTNPNLFGGPLLLIGKGLTVQAEAGAPVEFPMGFQVLDLPASSSVVLRDLRIGADARLIISGCAGPVWCENISVPGGFAGGSSDTFTMIVDCAQVFLDRCTMDGGNSGPFGLTTSSAVTASNSNVHIYDSVLTGGAGNSQFPTSPSGHGYKLEGGTLMVSGSTLQGGGTSPSTPCGGPGLWLTGANPKVWMRDTTVIGGEGGCVDALQIDAGSVTTLAGNARGFLANSPVRAGGISMLHFSGDPGDQVFLFVSLEQGAFFKKSFHGTLQLGSPLLGPIALGALPATGQLDLSFPVGALPAGVDGFAVYSQPFLLAIGGQIQIAGGSAQVFLDASL